MLNSQKFKTAEARAKAFIETCAALAWKQCEDAMSCAECQFAWLDREAEEKLLPCPFCGAETRIEEYMGMDHKPHYRVVCDDCYMQSCAGSRNDVIEKYNRVARSVAGKKEEK